MTLLTLESQPSFPLEDLTDKNAALLELLLANREIFEQAHHSAEEGSAAFRIGHRAILANTSLFIDSKERLDAVSNGVAKYEVISLTVNPTQALQSRDEALAYFINPDPTLDYLSLMGDTRHAFSSELPRTAEVIKESTPARFRSYQEYVLAGAALARMAELDTRPGTR